MKIFIRIALFLTSAYLTACASPAYFAVPNQRLDSPTVGGKWGKGNIGGGYTHPTYVVTVRDTDATPPSSSGSTITRHPDDISDSLDIDEVVIDVRVGLGSRFEISNVGEMTHLKYQFLGSSRLEHNPNEFLGAITADFMSISRDDGSDGDSDFTVDGDGVGASLILGYRGDGPWVYYVNLNYIDFNATTKIDQNPGNFKYEGDGRQVGAAVGVSFEKERGFFMKGEWAYSKTNWSGAEELELGSFGGSLGWAW